MKPRLFWIYLGLYTHQLTHGLQEFSVVCLFIIQLGAVFFIFGPRRILYMGCAVQVFLDVMIGLNGN